MMNAFLYGITLAFGLIIPLGIQNIFIFNQGATQSILIRAMPAVITAFLCDVILILCAIFGVSLIVLTIPWLKSTIFCVGIGFLTYMGCLTWHSDSGANEFTNPLSTKAQIIFSASVSLLNPHAIIDTIGVIGTNSLQFYGAEKLAFTSACICVSFCWFFGLCIAGHLLTKVDQSKRWLIVMNKISAIILWVVAIYLLKQLL